VGASRHLKRDVHRLAQRAPCGQRQEGFTPDPKPKGRFLNRYGVGAVAGCRCGGYRVSRFQQRIRGQFTGMKSALLVPIRRDRPAVPSETSYVGASLRDRALGAIAPRAAAGVSAYGDDRSRKRLGRRTCFATERTDLNLCSLVPFKVKNQGREENEKK